MARYYSWSGHQCLHRRCFRRRLVHRPLMNLYSSRKITQQIQAVLIITTYLNRYTVASNLWLTTEDLWEGSFSLFATVLITMMAIAMLKTSRMQDKWKHKLVKALDAHLNETEGGDIEDSIDKPRKSRFGRMKTWRKTGGKMDRRRALFLLPLITVTREGLEAMVFMSGVSNVSMPIYRRFYVIGNPICLYI